MSFMKFTTIKVQVPITWQQMSLALTPIFFNSRSSRGPVPKPLSFSRRPQFIITCIDWLFELYIQAALQFYSEMMWITRSIRRSLMLPHSHAASYSTALTSVAAVEAERSIREGPRNDWSRPEIKSIYDSPVLDLLFHAVCYLQFLFLFLVFCWTFCIKFRIFLSRCCTLM